jgi:hypothetical protein
MRLEAATRRLDVLASTAYDRLFALAHRILRDTTRNEDAVQECLRRPASPRGGAVGHSHLEQDQ